MQAQAEIRCLYDSAELQLLHFPFDSSFSIITFDIMHAKANGRSAFGSKLALKRGIDLFAVVPKRPNWYPVAATEQVVATIKELKNRPSVGYGASMGGYGVLKYSAKLGTDATLAFSPQATIDPDETGDTDRRYHRNFESELHQNMGILGADLGPKCYAMCDPFYAQDTYQRSLLPQCVTRIDLPMLDHKCAVAMTPSDNAIANFHDAIKGNTTGLGARLVSASQQTLQYAIGSARNALNDADGTRALDIIAPAISKFGHLRDAVLIRGRAYLETGDISRSLLDLGQLFEDNPQIVKIARYYSEALDISGDTEKAINVLKTCLELSGNGFVAIKLHRLLKKYRREEAERFAETAKIRWPQQASQFRT